MIAGGLAVVALAFVIAWRPVYGIAASAALLAVLGLLLVGRRLPQLFLGALAVALILYAFLGRGIAYLGASPIYMGEMVLMLGLLALVVSLPRFRISAIHVILFAFMAWGAARTIPYISQYGMDALRDGVLWEYAAFAIAISACLRAEHIRKLTEVYAGILPFFLAWVPLAEFADLQLQPVLPHLPGSPAPIIDFKGGDMGVHLAGAAAFLLIGLYDTAARRRASEFVLWLLWLFGVGLAAAINRGGMLAAGVGATIGAAFSPTFQRFIRPVLAALLVLAVFFIVNPEVQLSNGRYFSVAQLVGNLSSVVDSGSAPGGLEGSVEWRQSWWNEIINYTFNGPYFWAGKGFGINLATSDGFQTDAVLQSLRAPHNGHLDVLARSGVVGFGLWLAFLATFALTMTRAAILAKRRGDTFWMKVIVWILAYWVASAVNATFDVYLEGPQGGIWFWALTGIGIVAMRAAHDHASLDEQTSRQDEEQQAPSSLLRPRPV